MSHIFYLFILFLFMFTLFPQLKL